MTTIRFVAIAALAAIALLNQAGPAHADLRELDRDTARQDLAGMQGVVLVDVYAYW